MANKEIYNDDIFEDDLDVLEIIDFGFPRNIYVRCDHFHNLDELGFYERFRFTKQTTLQLLALIEGEIEYPTDMNQSVSPINQLLLFLRFMTTNGRLQTVADFADVHVSTASRTITRVVRTIARLYDQLIKFLRSRADIHDAQVKFYEIAQFPQVIGVVDGTHIRVQSPGGDEGEVFRNRKTYFSLNVQVIGDAELKIANLVARGPGLAHESTIFNSCVIRARFDAAHFTNCILLGDNGYPVRPYFLTPLLKPGTPAEQHTMELILKLNIP